MSTAAPRDFDRPRFLPWFTGLFYIFLFAPIALYARAEAVDIRISATGDGSTSAEDLVEGAAKVVLDLIGDHVWSTGDTTWSGAIGQRLEDRGWTLSIVEIGTAGQLASLLGDAPWLRFSEALAADAPGALAHGDDAGDPEGDPESRDRAEAPTAETTSPDALQHVAARARELGGSEVGMALRARPRGGDTAVSVVVISPAGLHRQRRLVFLGGAGGRTRSALAAAAILLEALASD